MTTWRLVSWNVNGLRATWKKGFLEWLLEDKPTVLGLQETKIQAESLTEELTEIDGYTSYWSHSQTKKGYSGVAIYTQTTPVSITEGMGVPQYDTEGRVLKADFGDFIFYTVYFPNGQMNEDRLNYKLGFYQAFLDTMNKDVANGREIVVCGDVNTAHKPIDLARPKENEKVSGFLPIEREWIDNIVATGYIDTYRHFYPEQSDQYSWWNMRTRARERNVGWRIDYFFISPGLVKHLKSAAIHPDIMGSDHCPVSIELEF